LPSINCVHFNFIPGIFIPGKNVVGLVMPVISHDPLIIGVNPSSVDIKSAKGIADCVAIGRLVFH
jgi:hypothetical protein